jgi:high affinity Mn2+ porin
MSLRLVLAIHIFSLCGPSVFCQVPAGQDPDRGKKWSIHFQSTAVGDWHGRFYSPYEGINSLPAHPETRMSFTATGFLGFRVLSNTQIFVDPEISAGRGFGRVTGIAGFPNGEITRVSSAAPTLYLARAYLRQVLGIGQQKENVNGEENEFGGQQPVRRLSLILGKFAMTDFFDKNKYANDPRTQFLNWALMANGAWDSRPTPVDTRPGPLSN